ncbi:MAG: exonuclease [Robiginitomaculum sp.]|nr:MAG: exonuclease [Robiginitomaculum sp.]
MDTFIALDVETANRSNQGSICQIGIAKYTNGILVDSFETLINPNDNFSQNNISIHGITPNDVADAPTFPEAIKGILTFIGTHHIVAHTSFDKRALNKACHDHDLETINNPWTDSALIARRTWDEVSKRGYNLPNLCDILDFEYEAHDALEDAKACANVLLSAMEHSEVNLAKIISRGQTKAKSRKSYPLVYNKKETLKASTTDKQLFFQATFPYHELRPQLLRVKRVIPLKTTFPKK